jgi:hypothetical protein
MNKDLPLHRVIISEFSVLDLDGSLDSVIERFQNIREKAHEDIRENIREKAHEDIREKIEVDIELGGEYSSDKFRIYYMRPMTPDEEREYNEANLRYAESVRAADLATLRDLKQKYPDAE